MSNFAKYFTSRTKSSFMRLKTIALLSCILFAANVGAETVTKTINVTFSNYEQGKLEAENERHDLGEGLVIYTNKCYFTEVLKMYVNSSSYVVSEPLPGAITKIELTALGDVSSGKFIIYGSTDGDAWNPVTEEGIKVGTTYKKYAVNFPQGSDYRCFKIGLAGYSAKIDIKSMSVTYTFEEPTTYDISINKYGYATLFLDMPFTMPESSTAYYCSTSGEVAHLLPIEGVVPANTGVIIESTPSSTCTLTYTTDVNPSATSIAESNQLMGYTEDTEVTSADYSYYALNVKDGKVGFYIPQTATDAGFEAKANKAYLQVPKGEGATMFVIQRTDDETEIVPIAATCDEVTYDLQGRIVAQPAPGIYIRGGKKIVIR